MRTASGSEALFSPPLPYGPDPLKDLRAEHQAARSIRSSPAATPSTSTRARRLGAYTLLGSLLYAPMANGQALRRSLIPDAGQP